MIIQLEPQISPEQLEQLKEQLAAICYQPKRVQTQFGDYLVCIGKQEFDIRAIGTKPGIRDVHRVSDAYKLVSGKWKLDPTEIKIREGVTIGPQDLTIMAGPCSIESEAQIDSTLAFLQEQGVKMMRGGVYKPRSSPYSFRGLGQEGLQLWYQKAQAAGIGIITEVMMVEQIEQMFPYVDIFQVGARNAQNFNLLDALGQIDKPVMLKRSMSGTIDELLQAAEYIFSNGNERIILCERGIRTYETAYRNCMDINAIALLKEKTHLPVIADPSHGVGIRRFVEPVTLASLMAGADGVMVEVHQQPEQAFSDGLQTLDYQQAAGLFARLRAAKALRDSWA